jgi:MarR family transcriptional regulator, 2-MHQ and catechol-resistance regulon repressor
MTTNPTGPETVLVLWKASRAVEARALASIAGTGLGATDFGILEALLHKGPLPVSVLGRKMLITSGSITSAVDRLVRRGLVARRDDAEDRRVRRVHLTAEGRRLIAPAFVRHAADLEETVGALSRDERRTLVTLLRKLGLAAAGATDHQETR